MFRVRDANVEASGPIHDSIVRREGEIACKTGEVFAQRNEGDRKKLRERDLTGKREVAK